MKKISKFKPFGDHELEFISDYEGGTYFDTEVRLQGQFICCIEGNKISEFHEKLTDIINKYRI
jgi:hypothetical protein